eukprot:scaffold2115_cov363-Pavlova_lutheri.AAC.6
MIAILHCGNAMKRDEHSPFACKYPTDTMQTDRTWGAKDSQEFMHLWRYKPTMLPPRMNVEVVKASRNGPDQRFIILVTFDIKTIPKVILHDISNKF